MQILPRLSDRFRFELTTEAQRRQREYRNRYTRNKKQTMNEKNVKIYVDSKIPELSDGYVAKYTILEEDQEHAV